MPSLRTGSRLHFGPLYWDGPGSRFGGVGMMVASPTNECDVGPDGSVNWTAEAPRHHGFGSGTQRACAEVLASGVPSDADALFQATGRGKRSAIGLHGAVHGGFLLDGGKAAPDALGELIARIEMPDWPLLIVRLRTDAGLSAGTESQAFADLPAMPAEVSARLFQLATDALLPAVQSSDLRTFAHALTEYGLLVGEFFSPVQGGRFSDPRWEELLTPLRETGCGVAQSSWGPAVVVFAEEPNAAETMIRECCPDADVEMTRPLNRGIEIRG